MKKIILIILIILVSCEKENSESNNFSTYEFVKLFPTYSVISNLELENNESIFIYSEWNSNEFKMSLLNQNGEITWTKSHENSLLGHIFFINEKLIYSYTSNSKGIFENTFSFTGNFLSSKIISNEPWYSIKKQNNDLYAIRQSRFGNASKLKIDIIQFSKNGVLEKKISLETSRNYSDLIEVIVQKNRIYFFGENNFESSIGSYSNHFCEIYDFSGNLIKLINTETSGRKSAYQSLVFENGNILMTVINFNKRPIDYDFRLFNSEGKLINSQIFNSPGNSLKLSLFENDRIGIAGSNSYSSSVNNRKKSQFVILDENLDELFEREIGSIDDGEVFFFLQEFNNYYYLIGNTNGTDGDFNIPNNTGGTDLFYMKLEK
ncbi:hypothetical protein [Polaribacter porphyrae]|nr:hypothetical protein [Polaribacter porphyrae]